MLTVGGAALLISMLIAFVGDAPFAAAAGLWVVLGVAVLADLIMSRSARKAITVDYPSEVFVGETVDLKLTVSNAPIALSGQIDWPDGISGDTDIAFTSVDGVARAVITCRAVRRGTWTCEHLWLIWTSHWGFFEYVPKLTLGAELRVVPNIRLVESGQITTSVNSALFGVKENRAIGEGSEFHQLQDFVQGMDVKTIDWKRSARKRSLVAKELRAERNHHVIIALDNGYLMREEIGGMPRIDHAITAALATAWAAAIGGDLVGFYSYDVRPRIFSAPTAGRKAFARLRSRTADLDYVSRETNHTLAMTELNARTPKRSLIIIFTDFVDTTSAELLIENIGILARRHLLIFVTLRDPELEQMVAKAPESMDGVAELVAANQSIDERRIVMERLTRMGVTVIDTEPGKVTAQLISHYLEIKAKELI
ncbi:DUF58 domain-containing protein [Yoonia sp. GPGPB17]|uniref:DUF58 domain-containing protein n=1 Tax=Yoonia sp. GPGPB17 TaxID=3026147 RepID=UPI0030C353E5